MSAADPHADENAMDAQVDEGATEAQAGMSAAEIRERVRSGGCCPRRAMGPAPSWRCSPGDATRFACSTWR